MTAVLSDRAFSDPEWVFERKLDGERCGALRRSGRVTLLSRTGRVLNSSYPELIDALAVDGPDLLLDGEIVAFKRGRASFERLQQRMNARPAAVALLAESVPVTYLAFDLLYLDWRPTLDLPYRQRRELLDALALAGPSWQTPPAFTDAAGEDLRDLFASDPARRVAVDVGQRHGAGVLNGFVDGVESLDERGRRIRRFLGLIER